MGETIIMFIIGQTFILLGAGVTWAIHVEIKLARIDERLKVLKEDYNG